MRQKVFTYFGQNNGRNSVCPSAASILSSASVGDQKKPHLVFPGGGIFFYHQAGVLTFLRENGYCLDAVTCTGASAGALTATLTATGVDFYKATELALHLAKQGGVWDRRAGLQGIWGPMIKEWLEELLPIDATERVGGVSLLVTPVDRLFGRKQLVSEFESREDLIECNMASIHIPWFLDGQLYRDFRGRPHIDGSFLACRDDYEPPSSSEDSKSVSEGIIVLNHSLDPRYESSGLFDFVEAVSPDGIWGLFDDGKRFGAYLEENGAFSILDK